MDNSNRLFKGNFTVTAVLCKVKANNDITPERGPCNLAMQFWKKRIPGSQYRKDEREKRMKKEANTGEVKNIKSK